MGELRVIECRGAAGERGRSHGEQLRSEVRDFYAAWVDYTCCESGATEQDLISCRCCPSSGKQGVRA